MKRKTNAAAGSTHRNADGVHGGAHHEVMSDLSRKRHALHATPTRVRADWVCTHGTGAKAKGQGARARGGASAIAVRRMSDVDVDVDAVGAKSATATTGCCQ
jgi:hypothetical protein